MLNQLKDIQAGGEFGTLFGGDLANEIGQVLGIPVGAQLPPIGANGTLSSARNGHLNGIRPYEEIAKGNGENEQSPNFGNTNRSGDG